MEGENGVQLYIYDLSRGMASVMSPIFMGKKIEGIWHTAVVIYGKEYFYGGQGIKCCPPGHTVLGQPQKIEQIGETFIPFQVFKDYIRGLSESTYRGAHYSLLEHNCNTFSEDLCQFLCGRSIPKYILELPQEFLSSQLGQSIAPLIQSLSGNNPNSFSFEPQIGAREQSPGFDDLNQEIELARQESLALEQNRKAIKKKIDKRDRKKEKTERKIRFKDDTDTGDLTGETSSDNYNPNSMSETGETEEMNGSGSNGAIPSEMLPSEKVLEEEARERALEEERRKNREPAIVFRTIDPKVELESLVKLLDGKLSKEEENAIEELHQYLIENEGSWALGDDFLIFVGRVLRDPALSPDTRVHLIRALGDAALKDDVVLILHQDRRDHVLMNYSQDIDKHTPEEQQAWGIFMCNLFENLSASEWLLYISEWNYLTQLISNIRATTKVAVHCLLANCSTLQDIGTGIIYNLAIKEVKTVVFDDVAVELAMAILQFLNAKPSEEHLFRCLKALLRFSVVSADVGQFIQMIGPHPVAFKGQSTRVDELIEEISKKVPAL